MSKNMENTELENETKQKVSQERKQDGKKETKKEEKQSKKEQKKESKSNAKIESLEKQIEELEEKVAKEKDDYLRLMAEFDNFRRRSSQDRLDLINTASADTIKVILPVIDDFERAIKILNDSSDSDAAKEGTQLIYNKLMSALKTKGLEIIDTQGKEFDTDLHEAVAQFPVDEDKKGKIYDTVLTGYTLNGKVIRFAKVVVGI